MIVVALSAAVLGLAVMSLIVPRDRVAAYALLFCVATLAVFGNNSAPRAVWVGAFISCGMIALVAHLRTDSALVARRSWTFWTVVAMWSWLTVGALLARSYSTQRLALYAGLCVLLAALAARIDQARRRLVLRGVLWIALGESAIGVVTLLTHATPIWGYRGNLDPVNHLLGDGVNRMQGTMGHPIVFGMLVGLAALIAWVNEVGLGRRSRMFWLSAMAVALVLSGTRSAIAATVACVALHLLLRRSVAFWLRNLMLGAAVAGILAVLDLGVAARLQALIQSGSWIHRMASLESIPALLGRPTASALFGSGFGSEATLFRDGLIPLTYGLPVVDDFWVYLLGTTGVIGFSVIAAALLVALGRAHRQGAVVIAFIVAMGFSFDLFVWLFAGVLISLLLPLGERVRQPPAPAFANGREAVPGSAGPSRSPIAAVLAASGPGEPHSEEDRTRQQADAAQPASETTTPEGHGARVLGGH